MKRWDKEAPLCATVRETNSAARGRLGGIYCANSQLVALASLYSPATTGPQHFKRAERMEWPSIPGGMITSQIKHQCPVAPDSSILRSILSSWLSQPDIRHLKPAPFSSSPPTSPRASNITVTDDEEEDSITHLERVELRPSSG
ncbi:hypothetical protein RRG08_038027 [Elysia crispata]|uniref:Uncharacterized protein n=1 Tax=Elysia crispata TaxID=231223 RepID=A0AAE1A052_9GAST|nr:hypothetical protein RRG08_038027 [Elysia crispata]